MANFLMKPKIDFAFKEIMMNNEARVGFLSAVLKLNPEDIKETQILNTNLRKIHMWNRSQGQSYKVFKRCVSISILDFTLFHDTEDFYSCFHLREDNRYTLYTDKVEFHVLELSKLPEELKEDTDDILLWAKFINAKQDDRGCNGAPDWIIEIVSPSSQRMDYFTKLFKYRTAGVREYWIVNPHTNTVNVYDLENDEMTKQYNFDDEISVCIYDNLKIMISELLK